MRRIALCIVKKVLRLKFIAQLSNRNIQTLGIASKSGVSKVKRGVKGIQS